MKATSADTRLKPDPATGGHTAALGGCLLASVGGRPLTKKLEAGGAKSAYADPMRFYVRPLDCSSLEELAAVLRNIQRKPSTELAIIRGRPRENARLDEQDGEKEYYRTKQEQPDGRPACFEDAPCPWAMFDFDGVPLPEGVDPWSHQAIYLALQDYLPAPFGSVGCIVQLSATHQHGEERSRQIRCHLWFWLSRPLTSAQLKSWLAPHLKQNGGTIDGALFDPIQLHYVCPPILNEGVPDPCPAGPEGRVKLLAGFNGSVVEVPDHLPEPEASKAERGNPAEDLPVPGGWDAPEAIEEYGKYLEGITLDYSDGAGTNDEMCAVLHAGRDFGVSLGKRVEMVHEAPGIAIEQSRWNRRRPDLARPGNLAPGTRHPDERVRRRVERAVCAARLAQSLGLDPRQTLRGWLERPVEPPDDDAVEDDEFPPTGHEHILSGGTFSTHTDAIATLNTRYAVMTTGENAGRVVCLAGTDGRSPTVLPLGRLHEVHANVKVEAAENAKPTSATRVWCASPWRRGIPELCFEPTGSTSRVPKGAYNSWRGFPLEPKEGNDHLPFLQHVEEIICNGDAHVARWVLDWMADLIQRPGDKPGTAIHLHSEETGTGNTFVSDVLARLAAPYSFTLSRPDDLTGRFNQHLNGKVFVALEEGAFRGCDRGEAETLRYLVTGRTVKIEPKGVNAFEISNHARIFATSNPRDAIPIRAYDRRWLVLEVSDAHARDDAYFGPLFHAFNHGELLSNLLRFLLSRQYDKAALRHPPMTASKGERLLETADPVTRWAYGILGSEGFSEFTAWQSRAQLYQRFASWTVVNARGVEKADARDFFKRLRALVQDQDKRSRSGNDRERCVRLAGLDECRERFASHVGFEPEWED